MREEVTLQLTGRNTPHVPIVNISSYGTVTRIHPIWEFGAPPSVLPRKPLELSLWVEPPIGADWMVAIETNGPAAGLNPVLAAWDGIGNLRGAWEGMQLALAALEHPPRVAIFPFHTAAE